MKRLALVIVLALAPACGGSEETGRPPAPQRPVIGIGEQRTAMFSDPRFRALGIQKARLVTAWDTTRVPFERDLVDTWLAEARRAGVEPFITFGHSRVNPGKLPSVSEFRTAFGEFRKRYPSVRVYAPWNEINHSSQPTDDNPRRAAEYYNVVRAECRGCTVLAGDVLDQEGMTRYLAEYRRHLDGSPRIWGLHNYSDANRFRDRGLQALLEAVPGDVWLTETGGIVRFGRSFPRSERRAARALSYMLRLARRTERVKRVYVYNWTGAAPDERFDAGLVGPDGRTRRGYEVLRAALRD
ncbi:MAG: hypothetical protein H0T43_05850 [Solirubrobacterales bacterium]|nr:hypothetical protein [Solirubrobacterales bacterium]